MNNLHFVSSNGVGFTTTYSSECVAPGLVKTVSGSFDLSEVTTVHMLCLQGVAHPVV